MSKPILIVDFDACVHLFSTPWQGADIISDPPVEGALGFILEAIKHFEVHIFSSRSHQDGGIWAMKKWLQLQLIYFEGLPINAAKDVAEHQIKWPTHKPDAPYVMIDDRAFNFDGDWSKFNIQDLLAFKPWNHHLRHPP